MVASIYRLATPPPPPEDHQAKLNGPNRWTLLCEGGFWTECGISATEDTGSRESVHTCARVSVHVYAKSAFLVLSMCKYALCMCALAPLWLPAGGGIEGHAGLTQDV